MPKFDLCNQSVFKMVYFALFLLTHVLMRCVCACRPCRFPHTCVLLYQVTHCSDPNPVQLRVCVHVLCLRTCTRHTVWSHAPHSSDPLKANACQV